MEGFDSWPAIPNLTPPPGELVIPQNLLGAKKFPKFRVRCGGVLLRFFLLYNFVWNDRVGA